MFRNTTLKITALYLSIIMLISLFFSFTIYQISVRELERGFRQEDRALRGAPPIRELITDDDFIETRQERLLEARQRIFGLLAYTNLVILGLGGGLSYVLARRTLKPIEESHEAQKRFTADASHELRTPLTAMQTEIEVALRDATLTKTEAKDLLKSNLEELAKLQTLSNNLLHLAQFGTNPDHKDILSIDVLLHSAVAKLKPLADKKKMKIQIQAAESHQVLGNKDRLEEMFVTLLDNAIKYSPIKTSVDVTVETRQKNLLIHIVDHGPGIKASEIPHIFDRFYRADISRTRDSTHGYGLGLAIAQSIAELHDGSISVRSELNKGSRFTVQLPAKLQE